MKSSSLQHVIRMPRKAILLAAGFGTRMEPLSLDAPKPMMPLFGVPLLEHAVLSLEEWGVQEILINLHHLPGEILAWGLARKGRGPRIVFSFEPEILGTGGALRRADHFVGPGPCWLVNTDIAFVLQPDPFVKMFQKYRPPAVLWLDGVRGPRTVSCNSSGIITDFAVAHPGSVGTFTYCGVQLFHPRLLQALPDKPFCSVIDACRTCLQRGDPVYGVCPEEAYWSDLGTPERYLQAHAEAPDFLQSRGNARMPRKGCCQGSVLWSGARLVSTGSLVRSIAGRHVRVHVPVEDSCVVRADLPGLDPVVPDVLKALHMPSGDTLYIALPRRGSDRMFVRLAAPRTSAILIRYREDRRPENARYAGHARFLQSRGIPVPQVLFEDASRHVLVLEDAGSTSLQDVAFSGQDAGYLPLMRSMAKLHRIPLKDCPPLEPGFDHDLYRWEHNLFLGHFLKPYLCVGKAAVASVKRELAALAGKLVSLPLVPVHRDFQSSNVLLHRNQALLIDFQGMRAGPAVYDLASLLYDPYVELGPKQHRRYLDEYLRGASADHKQMIREMLPLAGIQRLCQALGAFGRLAGMPETARFAKHIPVGVLRLQRVLEETGACRILLRSLRVGAETVRLRSGM
jgi:N-acetylmuramate 1-kinase